MNNWPQGRNRKFRVSPPHRRSWVSPLLSIITEINILRDCVVCWQENIKEREGMQRGVTRPGKGGGSRGWRHRWNCWKIYIYHCYSLYQLSLREQSLSCNCVVTCSGGHTWVWAPVRKIKWAPLPQSDDILYYCIHIRVNNSNIMESWQRQTWVFKHKNPLDSDCLTNFTVEYAVC